jgi:hypothetical protein
VRGPVIAAIIIAAVLLVGGFLTLGIPGAIYAATPTSGRRC